MTRSDAAALPPQSEWLSPPPGSDTVVIPAGDPSARDLPDDDSSLPPPWAGRINPDPQRKYRVHGRKPPGFEVMLFSRFHAYGFGTPACNALLIDQGVTDPDFQGQIFREVPVRQTRYSFEATLVIDRFKDDACQWVYQSTDMRIRTPKAKGSLYGVGVTSAGSVIDNDFYHTDDMVLRCPDDQPRCNQAFLDINVNAFDEPVIVRCATFPAIPENLNSRPSFHCQDSNFAHKKRHMLKPGTRDIRIDIYDVDVEPDPMLGKPNPPASLPKPPKTP